MWGGRGPVRAALYVGALAARRNLVRREFTRGCWQQANRRSGVGGLDAQAAYRLKSGAQRPRTLGLCFLADYLTEAINLL